MTTLSLWWLSNINKNCHLKHLPQTVRVTEHKEWRDQNYEVCSYVHSELDVYKILLEQGMAVHIFNPGTREAELGRCLWVRVQSDLQSEFLSSQDYTVRLYLKLK